ncbi:hypothetical protein GvMRE_IIg115 [endosymbiont GvMRE of Glomus versiforme]|nr:hypothetical protein GvMRE_IIg115 [endosymbiont GvMRE of Glomus versiforme]
MITRKKKIKIVISTIILFSHIISIILSSCYDKARQYAKGNQVQLSELRYWLWFFTWWSSWASLLTIPWCIHKLFSFKKSGLSRCEQILDMMIVESNLISGVLFLCGGFYFTVRTAFFPSIIVMPFIGTTRTIYVYLLYNFFWHLLAPFLTFYYFLEYCQVDKLVINKKWLVINFFNPFFYFACVMIRPMLKNINYYPKLEAYTYPQNYPYPPFFWAAGCHASKHEKLENNSLFYFWNNWSVWKKRLFWTLIIITTWWFVFSFLFIFLMGLKKKIKMSTKMFLKCL